MMKTAAKTASQGSIMGGYKSAAAAGANNRASSPHATLRGALDGAPSNHVYAPILVNIGV
jgi:hypothetical protein